MKSKKQYTIVVSLNQKDILTRHLPEACLVHVLPDNQLGVLRANANQETVETYNVDVEAGVINKTIVLCDRLSIGSLEEKYCKRGRGTNSLSRLFEQEIYRKSILNYIDRGLNELFLFLDEHNISLVVDIPRKTRLEQIKIVTNNVPLDPILRFEKTVLGVKYFLKLSEKNGQSWSPVLKDVMILSNDSPWVIVNYRLSPVKSLNGNKLKPFLNKEYIFIKKEIVTTYFEKFIVEVARKVEIEAEGFEVVYYDEITSTHLNTTFDFIRNEVVLDLVFKYKNASFSYGTAASKRTRLNITGDNNISILQSRRNRNEESKYINILKELGLNITASKRFSLEGKEDGYEIINFLKNSKKELKEKGFVIDVPSIEGKEINLDPHSITLKTNKGLDWFDVHAVVKVGNHSIPFVYLLEHINDGNRFYPLEDKTCFIIPETWMTKYGELAKFGKNGEDAVRVKKSQFTLIDDIDETFSGMTSKINLVEEVDYVQSPNLKATLRPYQMEGVKWLIKHQVNGLGACLADDMGLGKTLQTLAVLSHTKDGLKRGVKSSPVQLTLFAEEQLESISPLRALIVLPASLVFNWYEEIKKFNPGLHTLRYVGASRVKSKDNLDKFDIVLTTYHTVLREADLLKSIDWEYIVLDESQMIKNKESKMFKTINKLTAENRISLSGTPIENSLSDLWSQMEFINPGMLGSFSFFKTNFLTPIEKFKDEDALAQLSKLIQPFILRRTKEEVAKDLPSLTEKIEYIEMDKTQKDVYEKTKSATRNLLLGLDQEDRSYKFHVFAALTKMRQLANDPHLVDPDYNGESGKVKYILSQMDMVAKSGHKVLIFSSFTKLINVFTTACDESGAKYVTLTGADSQKKRKASVDAFQNDDEISFFFISLKAGGTGLNLTAADYVFILDPWWNPFAEKQAIARAHRIGQDKPVTVIRYISKDSIEEKILKLQEKKKSLSDGIFHMKDEKMSIQTEDMQFILN